MWFKSDQGSTTVRPCHYRERCPSHKLGNDKKRLRGFFLISLLSFVSVLRVKDKCKHSGEKENEVGLDPAVTTWLTATHQLHKCCNHIYLSIMRSFKAKSSRSLLGATNLFCSWKCATFARWSTVSSLFGLVNSRHLGVLYLALYPDLEGFHHKLATGFESVLDIKSSVGFFNIL